MRESFIYELCKLLLCTTTLKTLILDTKELNDSMLTLILNALASNKSVVHFEMDLCYVGMDSVDAFLAVLRENKTLRHIGILSSSQAVLQKIANEIDCTVLTSIEFDLFTEEDDFGDEVFKIQEKL